MKILYLLRHAKSSWDDPTLDDFHRPLNTRGLKTAPLMAQYMHQHNLRPDFILSSTAKRAHQTAELMVTGSIPHPLRLCPDFYPGNRDIYIKELSKMNTCSSVMIVGHNPGLENFLHHLTGRKEKIPTGALIQIKLPLEHWNLMNTQTQGTLIAIYKPKELFPELKRMP